jgi:hypothetical protein
MVPPPSSKLNMMGNADAVCNEKEQEATFIGNQIVMKNHVAANHKKKEGMRVRMRVRV